MDWTFIILGLPFGSWVPTSLRYRQSPQAKVLAWSRPTRTYLYDHCRGAGKTRLMAMLSLVSIKKCGTRCILVVVDRTDLAQQACQEFNDLLERCFKISISKQKTEQRPEVFQVNNAMELQKYFCKMVEDPKKRLVLTVTLQSFPHLRGALPKELEETTVVMADEVHRSHADKAFSEELSKVLGGRPRLLLFTGTASDRCLRMFGEREGQHFVPFHAVAEETVPWK